MDNKTRISFVIEAIAASLGILRTELLAINRATAEIQIGRKVLYMLKERHIPQMTNEEFFRITGISLRKYAEEENTTFEEMLYTKCDTHYKTLLSHWKSESLDHEELILRIRVA